MIYRLCPECVNGKHINCTRMILTEEQSIGSHGTMVDVLVPCGCPVCKEARSAPRT